MNSSSAAMPVWILLLGGVVILWLLWRHGGRSGRRMIGLAAGIAALAVVIGGLSLFSVRRTVERNEIVSRSRPGTTEVILERVVDEETDLRPTPATTHIIQELPAHVEARRVRPLDRESTDGLEPDVYPSERSAVVAGARVLLLGLSQVVPDGVELAEVSVTGVGDDRTRSELTTLIQRQLPAVHITFNSMAESQPAEASTVALHVEAGRDLVTAGDVHHMWFTRELTLIGAGGQLSRAVHVMTKSWVEDPQGYQSRAGGQWLVADPGTLAGTQEQALDGARRAAAEQLEPLVRARAVRQPDLQPGLIDSGRGRRLIEAELAHGSIRDSFVQTFERPAGKVYRAALLLDISDTQMERLTREYSSMFSARQTRLRSNVLSGAGLILVILLVYVFLNAATKGYYVWSLRIACTVLVVTGVLAMAVLV